MSDYIQGNVDKIITDKNLEYPKNIALAAAWIMANSKGFNLKILNVSQQNSLADYYILGSCNNPQQANSMSGEIVNQMKRHNIKILSEEGAADSEWILLDLGEIIIHLFLDISREVFDLDNLLKNAPQLPIPNDFYYGPGENENADDKDSDTDYF